jgi:hypothetical protein
MVSLIDYLSFLNFEDRIKFVKKILIEYNFDKIDLGTASRRKICAGNLRSFESQLIRDGVEKDEIEVMIGIVEGDHPLDYEFEGIGTLDYNRIGVGWKIHLTVQPKSQKFVYEWLRKNCKYIWKYLHGGEEGKTFTIYVGSWDDTEEFARVLMKSIGDKIDKPRGDIVEHDLEVYQKVWARFDATRCHQYRFHQYGSYGLPYLLDDHMQLTVMLISGRKAEYEKNKKQIKSRFLRRAYTILNQIYGTYFGGTQHQVARKIADALAIE